MKVKKHFLLVALFSVLSITVALTACGSATGDNGGTNTSNNSGNNNTPGDNNNTGDNGGSNISNTKREVFGFFGPEWLITYIIKMHAGKTYSEPENPLEVSGSEPSVTNSMRAADRVTISVMSFTDEVPGMIEECINSLNLDCKMNTTIIARENGEYESKLNQMLEDGDIDIFTAEAAFVIKYSGGDESKYVAPYEDFIENLDDKLKAADIANYIGEVGTNKDGKIVALSTCSAGCCFIYRRSIAKKVFGTDDPESIGEIIGAKTGSWDKFLEAAQKCKEKGYAMISSLGDIYHIIEGSSSGWFDENNKLQIDEKQEAYLEIAKQIIENGWSNNTIDWTDDWYADMRGKDGTYGDWAVCLPPAGAFWGGTWYFVTKEALKNPQKKQVIADIIEYLTLNTTNEGGMYKFLSVSENYFELLFTYGAASGIVMQNTNGTFDICKGQNIHKVYAQADKMVNNTHMTVYDEKINSIWQEQVQEYAEGKKTKDEAIKTLKDKVKSKFEEIVID